MNADIFNREQAFLLYATFCGDVERTAFALRVKPIDVLRVADEENWASQLGNIITLAKSKKPGDVERAISRALNYVQAHRLRLFNDRVLNRLYSMTNEELDTYVFQEGKAPKGSDDPKAEAVKKLSCRALADLASAIEKAQAMTYQALHDTATDRTKRLADGGSGEIDVQTMHTEIIKALNAAHSSKAPRALLADAQLKQAESIVARQGYP